MNMHRLYINIINTTLKCFSQLSLAIERFVDRSKKKDKNVTVIKIPAYLQQNN